MGACGVGGRGEKEPFRTEFWVIQGAIEPRSTSDRLRGEQAVAGHTPLEIAIVRQAKPGEEEDEVDIEIFNASLRVRVPRGQG